MRSKLRLGAVLAVLLAVASVTVGSASSSSASSAPADGRSCGGAWRVVPSPNLGSADNELRAVSALSPRRVWAVGSFLDVDRALEPLITRWDGEAWTVVPSPTLALGGQLFGVDARSPRDVWAVGDRGAPFVSGKTLIEHWDGRAWRVVSSPNAPAGPGANGHLNAVLALSRDNAWAVGSHAAEFTPLQPLIEHWDGRRWQVVAASTGFLDSTLRGLGGTGPENIWAVGDQIVKVGPDVVERALILHWDGSDWTEVPAPPEELGIGPAQPYALLAVAALSRRNAWAVGRVAFSATATHTLVLHWNGRAWKRVRSPQPSADFQTLNAIEAINAKKIWAVGSHVVQNELVTLVQRWNGKRWRLIPSENGESSSELVGVSAAGRARFAVGFFFANAGQGPVQTLVLHGCTRQHPNKRAE
jgi:hypothetical protein